jgi:predicted N-acetyltransferase YhbS
MTWTTRAERAADVPALRALLTEAFDGPGEAALVDALRADPDAWLPGMSVVAEEADGTVIGHALLTRCHIGEAPALALAPCAVRTDRQREGVGGSVVRAALGAARSAGESAVVVLGHPSYYPRFGFTPCAEAGITAPPGAHWPREAFLALPLDGARLPRGRVRYPPAFGL